MMTRRELLFRSAGLTSGLVTLGAPVPDLWRLSAAAAEARSDSPILVVIELTGGNDGLNTVVPHADDIYHKSRPVLRIEPKTVLKLDDRVGLHPALKELREVWESGGLAVVQGVGYPNPNRSHTRSMEIWQTGVVGTAPPAGWLGRTADAHPSLKPCHVGNEALPLAVRGRTITPDALASVADFRLAPGALLPDIPENARAADAILDQVGRQFAAARKLAARLAVNATITASGNESASEQAETLEGRMETIRHLLEADLPARVYYTAEDGFDTHANQPFTHERLLSNVSRAVAGFLKKLKRKPARRTCGGHGLHRVRPKIERECFERNRPRNGFPRLDRRQAGQRGPARNAHQSGRSRPRGRSSLHDRLPRRLCHLVAALAGRRSRADPRPA